MSQLIDNSIASPGKQGWWRNESESIIRTRYFERIHWDELEDTAPQRVTRRPAKAQDPEIMIQLRKAMKLDGMDAGVSLMALTRLLFGTYPPWKRQLIGSCVASGGMRVVTLRTLAEVVVLGEPGETMGLRWAGPDNFNTFAPYNYRAGRKIGGLNGGDGSFCGAHIKGLMTYGMLCCDTGGLSDHTDALPEPQSTSTYRRWGNSNQLLNQFSSAGKKYDLLESERTTSASQLKTVVTSHLKPSMICSGWAFRPDYQHDEWRIDGKPVTIYKRDRSTSWAHNMSLPDVVFAFNRWWVRVVNSWGPQAHRDGAHFWIPLELFGEWVKSAEVRTIGDLVNRPRPNVPFWEIAS